MRKPDAPDFEGLTGEIWRDFLPYCWKLARYQSTDIYKGMSCSALISKVSIR